MPANRFAPPSAGADTQETFTQVSEVLDTQTPVNAYKPELGSVVQVPAGVFRRLAPRATGQNVLLPIADSSNFGAVTRLFVETAQGTCRIRPVSGTINALTSLTFAAGTGTYLVELTSNGNGRWATLSLPLGSVSLTQLQAISPGRVLGLQVDAAGAASPVELTGAEVAEIVRYPNRQQTVAGGTQNDFALDPLADELLVDADTIFTGFAAATEGREFMLRVGNGFTCNLEHLNGGSAAANQIGCPGSVAYIMGSRDCVYLRYSNAVWRVIDRAPPRGLVQAIVANASATAATTNLSGGVYTAPAFSITAGAVYRATLYFFWTHLAAATPTLTAEFLINGAVVETVVLTPVAAAANYSGKIEALFTCRTTGAGGTAMVSVQFLSNAGQDLVNVPIGSLATATDAIDTTADRTLELRVRMTTAVVANTLTVTQGFTERL